MADQVLALRESSSSSPHPYGTRMLVVLSGLPGTGKSALAEEIARRLHLPIFSVDPIESAILKAGIQQSFETGLAAYLVVETLADSQLRSGRAAIVDAVNSVEEAKDMWRRLVARHSGILKVIECRCSDRDLHRLRLESRRRGLAESFKEPTWEDVQRRKVEYTHWREPILAIDSVMPLERNLEWVLEFLGQPGLPSAIADQ